MICPDCGVTFQPTNGRQRFCTPAHKQAFHKLMSYRGQVLTALAQTWRKGRHGKNPERATYAFREMCSTLDTWNTADRSAGRLVELTVSARMDADARVMDTVGRRQVRD